MSAVPENPVLALAGLTLTTHPAAGRDSDYACSSLRLGPQLGMTQLGVGMYELAPGMAVCPFHNHHTNDELYLVLEGEGHYRIGERSIAVKAGELLSAPAGGRETAHQLRNTGKVPLRYLIVSSMHVPDICEYPDSDKFLVRSSAAPGGFHHIGRRAEQADYWEGE